MVRLADYRERYGAVYIVEAPDGLVVPFRLLTLKEYYNYIRDIRNPNSVPAIIENEIWKECVQDEVLAQNVHKQKGGTVSFVVDSIIRYSFPLSAEELNFAIDSYRQSLQDPVSEIIVNISVAFPGYTPDELYNMNMDELLFKFALAEKKLLNLGIWKEGIVFENLDSKKEAQRPSKKKRVDPSKLKEAYEKLQPEKEVERQIPLSPIPRSGEDQVITGQELVHVLDTDPGIGTREEKVMLNEAKVLYKDYLEKTKKGEKVKIKPYEQRMQEAKERIEQNRKKLLKSKKKDKVK